MNIQEYQKEIQRTVVPGNLNSIEFALGIGEETGEIIGIIKKNKFQKMNFIIEDIKEELGDLMWYITNLVTYYKLDIAKIYNKAVYESTYNQMLKDDLIDKELLYALKVCYRSGRVVEYVEKIHYNLYESDFLEDLIINLYCEVFNLAKSFEITISEIMNYNIKKLKIRYPNGFDKEDCINRVDIQRRKLSYEKGDF